MAAGNITNKNQIKIKKQKNKKEKKRKGGLSPTLSLPANRLPPQ
jgi:hypothetical protein